MINKNHYYKHKGNERNEIFEGCKKIFERKLGQCNKKFDLLKFELLKKYTN